MRTFFTLAGIDQPVPDPLPDILAHRFDELADIRGPDEAVIDADALAAGGYPILVLTSGRLPSFEAIAAALVAHAGARHVVVPGTDHNVQDAGEPVNQLLEQHCSAAT